MMAEVTNPFALRAFSMTSHKRLFTEYDANGAAKQPLGYVTIADHNFDQEQGGGNWYYNNIGQGVFEGNGQVICGNASAYHAPEFWRDEISENEAKLTYVEYGMVLINLTLADRFEDHNIFQAVSFTWKIKKLTVVTEQEFEVYEIEIPNPPGNPDIFYDSTPGAIVETERSEETLTFTFQLPGEFEQGKHDFDSNRDLSDQQKIDRGFVFPKGGTFHDGSPKHGFDSFKEVTEVSIYDYPPPNAEGFKYDVVTKKTVTRVTYETPNFSGKDGEETCSPPEFFIV
jgi:hypothetical protein